MRIMGSDGLKEGAIWVRWMWSEPETPAIGGIDWGNWGEGRRASSEVWSSIVYEGDRISQLASSTRYL